MMIFSKIVSIVYFLELICLVVQSKFYLVETEDDQVQDYHDVGNSTDYSNDETCKFDSYCNHGSCPPCAKGKTHRKACGLCIKIAMDCPPCDETSKPHRKKGNTKTITRRFSSSSSKRSYKRTYRKVTNSKKSYSSSSRGDYYDGKPICVHGYHCNGYCPPCVYCCPNLYCECNGKIVAS